jgi:DNA repair exonuclease SbcCD ATPase subunit
MAAEMNELLEEGVTRCAALTDAADEALDGIDEMTKRAEGLVGRVADEGQEACRHLRELTGRFASAESALEGAHTKAGSGLETLATKAAQVRTEAGELLDRVKTRLAEIESRQEEMNAALDAQVASTQQDFQELGQRTQEAQARADEELQQAAQAIGTLRTAIEEARAAFALKQQAWGDAVAQLETTVQEKASVWVDGLNELLRRQAQALVGAGNAMVDQHNAAMDGLKERFAQRAPEALDVGLGLVEAALTALGATAAECGQRIADDSGALGPRATSALAEMAPIQTALETAAALA